MLIKTSLQKLGGRIQKYQAELGIQEPKHIQNPKIPLRDTPLQKSCHARRSRYTCAFARVGLTTTLPCIGSGVIGFVGGSPVGGTPSEVCAWFGIIGFVTELAK